MTIRRRPKNIMIRGTSADIIHLDYEARDGDDLVNIRQGRDEICFTADELIKVLPWLLKANGCMNAPVENGK